MRGRGNRSWREGLYSRGVVRTRGYIPTGPGEETAEVPVRQWGAVPTRGETAMQAKPWQRLTCEALGGLLDELRKEQDGFPITIVVEGIQTAEAQSFLECLHRGNLLRTDDVLWVLGQGAYEDVVPETLRRFVSESAYLNTQEGEQNTLADTLVPDVVFVADKDAEELKKRLRKWERRVWTAIIALPKKPDPDSLPELKLGIEKKPEWLRYWQKSAK